MTSVNWNLSLGQFLKCTRGIVGSHPNISALSSMTGLAQNSILWLIWLILRDSMSHLQIWENSIQYAVLIDCCKSLLNSMTSDLFSMTLEVIWIIFWRLANTSRWSQKLYDRKCQWLFCNLAGPLNMLMSWLVIQVRKCIWKLSDASNQSSCCCWNLWHNKQQQLKDNNFKKKWNKCNRNKYWYMSLHDKPHIISISPS